jgi:hypothetical protein
MRSQAGQPRLFAPYYSAGRWRQQFLVAALSRGTFEMGQRGLMRFIIVGAFEHRRRDI